MTAHEKIIDKISKLLAHAEGTSNEAEAATFMGKAQKLMLEHAVEEAMLAKANPERRTLPVKKTIDFGKNQVGIKAKRALIGTIAKLNRCNLWMLPGRQYLQIAGFQEDVEFVEMLYRSIEVQMTAAARSAGSGRSYTTNFIYGYVGRVIQRLEENARINKQDIIQGSTSTALVLADRKAEVDLLSPEKLHKGPAPRHRANYSASSAGYAAGGRADISGGRNNIAGRKALN